MNGVQTLKKKLENCQRISATTLTHLSYGIKYMMDSYKEIK